MRRIQLSRQAFALVDDEDYRNLARFKWSVKPSKHGGMYAVTNVKENGFWRQLHMHRMLMSPPADRDVIFLDYNGLDCRKNNLAIVDKVEARRHHRVRKDCYTGIKGVTFDPEFQTWGAVFVPNGKVTVIGAFDTVEEATDAYDQAVKRNYGPLAPLHNPVDKHSSARRTPPPYVPPPQRRSRSRRMEAVEVES